MGTKRMESGQGLLLQPSGSVHTCFMRFPIDVVFLDRDLQVLRVAAEVPQWRLRVCRGARAVLELRAGEAARAGINPGDTLALESHASVEPKEEAHAVC